MVSRSSDKTESVRVTEVEQTEARRALDGTGWTIGELLRAVVVAVAAKPAEVLELLRPYRRERKLAGRPRKATPPTA